MTTHKDWTPKFYGIGKSKFDQLERDGLLPAFFLEPLTNKGEATMPKHATMKKCNFKSQPESWDCVDCGVNTAPGCSTRTQLEQAFAVSIRATEGITQTIDNWSEVYMVKPAVWQAAGMDGMGGCLCIGCLEKRLDRTLVPRDFNRKHPFHSFPGTKRLLARRDGRESRGA